MTKKLIQAAIALAVFIVGLIIIFQVMKMYTHHGEAITVPDFKEASIDQVKALVDQKNLKFEIQDSTYVNGLPPGAVIDQSPKADSKVKEKRTIYLTVNASNPPPVKMVDLVDNSLRQAKLKLRTMGLEVGDVVYRPDIYRDVVLEQLHNGKAIKKETVILKGETIDLVVGDGLGNRTMKIPDLVGLSYSEALLAIQANALNVGKVVYNGDQSDIKTTIVYDQSPEVGQDASLQMGEGIDIYLTVIEEG